MPKIAGWTLEAEDLSHLGGPMGTEYTTTMFVRNFGTLEEAKTYAIRHYKGPIKWLRERSAWTSGDLLWVEYTITPLRFEEVG